MDRSQKPPQTSICCRLIQCIVLVVMAVVALVPLLYHFGSDQWHQDVPHPLDSIFLRKDQKALTSKLNKKAYKYSVIKGTEDSGWLEYLEHYADQRTAKGKTVIFRKVDSDPLESVFKLIRETKDYIEEQVDIEPDQLDVEWIFAVKSGQVPVYEIEAIMRKNPSHRILVGTTSTPAIKGFKSVKYPALTLQMFDDLLVDQFAISDQQASILTGFYSTVPQIFQNLNHLNYSRQQHLGPYFHKCDQLPATVQNVLLQLCETGKAVVDQYDSIFQQLGVIVHKKQAYWSHRKCRLNYELNNLVHCQDTVVHQSVLEQIEAEKTTTDNQQQPIIPEKKQKQKKAKKGKKKQKKPSKEAESQSQMKVQQKAESSKPAKKKNQKK